MTKLAEHTKEIAPIDIRQLSEQEFAELGVARLAYIKPVAVDGKIVFAIHAANGTPMALAEGRDVALAAVEQHEMLPVLVH
jgi:hypothetical protein